MMPEHSENNCLMAQETLALRSRSLSEQIPVIQPLHVHQEVVNQGKVRE
jgi:hypothetical protein